MQIRSRRGRPVKTSQAKVVRPDGSAISIPIASMDIDADEAEKSTVIQCSRIWDWAVAKGYTEETGEYTPLRRRGKDETPQGFFRGFWGGPGPPPAPTPLYLGLSSSS